ncbi:MAG: phosphate acyltransferase PlsX [Thermodesulfobacteriota bacterium]
MNIAVDAMGGDYAPDVVVQGALQASCETGETVTLVGDDRAIREALRGRENEGAIEVLPCDEYVHMDESPLKAIRSKPGSSIMVAFDLVRQGRADAVVSAGNSGATFMAGVLTLGKVEGVERPALAGIFPARRGDVVLIDVGANVDCRPLHLLQFGFMAQAFATACLGMQNPLVGLLSIGEEEEKGNDQVRAAHRLFRASPLRFKGNVEGREIFSGEVQIIVCDGFVGNVALKVAEGFSEAMSGMIMKEMMSTLRGRLGLALGKSGYRRLFETLDYETYGGAPILGINGIGIVCHGGSSSRAVKNGVKRAAEYVKNGFERKLSVQMAEFQRTPPSAQGVIRKETDV